MILPKENRSSNLSGEVRDAQKEEKVGQINCKLPSWENKALEVYKITMFTESYF